MLYGWTGKRLVVDLSTETTDIESIDEDLLYRFIGGRGLGTRFLLDNTKATLSTRKSAGRAIYGTYWFH